MYYTKYSLSTRNVLFGGLADGKRRQQVSGSGRHTVGVPDLRILILTMTVTELICGCGRQPDAERPSVVRDNAGVTVVSNHPDEISRGCMSVTPEPVTAIRPVTQLVFCDSCHGLSFHLKSDATV